MRLHQLAILSLVVLICAGLTVPAGCVSGVSTSAPAHTQDQDLIAVAGDGASMPWPELVLPKQSFFAAASADGSRKVFAHFMLCCGSFGNDVRAFRQDIAMARSMGIDGFALNAGEWLHAGKDGRKTIPTYYKTNATAMFAAADELGGKFSLFFSADMAGELDDVDITDMMTTFRNRPSYLKVDGRPVLSAYGANRAPGGPKYWGELRKRLGLFVVPFAFSTVPNETPSAAEVSKLVADWKGAVDGLFYFGAAGLPFRESRQSLTVSSEFHAAELRRAGKLYMAPYSPYYWGEIQPRRRYFEYEGGRGTAAQWDSIIKVAKPQWVEVVTWNDPVESQIVPVDARWSQTRYYDARVPYQDRRGYAELLRYYIAWFKSGQEPRITHDALFWFYRVQPMASSAQAAWKDGEAGLPHLFEQPRAVSSNTRDAIYLTTALTAPARIEVNSGGKITHYDAPKGISHMAIPFTPGQQRFALSRDGRTLVEGEGAQIAARFDYYNYWPTSGFIMK